MAEYDPYRPYVIGNGFVPLVESATTVDTGAEIGYRFFATEDFSSSVNGANWLRVVTSSPPPGLADRSEIVCRLYSGDPLSACSPLQQIVVPCTVASGGTPGGGAATALEAVTNPSDPYYLRITGASAKAKFWFGTDVGQAAEVLAPTVGWDKEVVDVSVLYSISGPFAEATTNVVSLGLERQVGPITWYMDNLVTGPSEPASITTVTRSRLGELNPFWDAGTDPGSEPIRGPWVYQGASDAGLYALSGNGTDDVAVFFETGASADGAFDIQYVALQVTYRSNYHLVGIGGFDLSYGSEVSEGLHTYRCPMMPAYDPWDYTGGGGTTTLTLSEGASYTLTVSRAYSGSVSVSSPTPIPITMIDTVEQHIPGLTGVKITKPLTVGSIPTETETTIFPAIVIFDADPWDWDIEMIPSHVNPACHAYAKQKLHAIHDYGYYYSEQEIGDDAAGTFVWATFYARASDSVTGALYVSQTDGAGTTLGPEGSIDYATWLALPEITDGWRKITLRLSPGAVLAGAGGVTHWQFWTTSAEVMLWEVLGATANATTVASGASSGAVAGYYGESATASFRGTPDYPLDMTLTLSQEMDEVTGLAVSQATQSLSVVDENCGRAVDNIPTGIVYTRLQWDPVLTEMLSGWGSYQVERRDTSMAADVWETVAEITNPYVTEFADYEARIGLQSSYRIRTTHVTGIEGPWSSSVSATTVAPGVTGSGCGVGLLVFTSNEAPESNLAYVHVRGSGDPEEFDFVEAGQAALEPVYRRDFQVALRPTERGGVSFSRTVLVNKVGIPDTTLDRGFTSIRDLAWASVPYVCVRDELGNRWLSTVTVPSGSILRTDHGLSHYLVTTLTITEVTDTPQALDVATPYLGLTTTENTERYATIASCAPLATVEDIDIRVKMIRFWGGDTWGFFLDRHDPGPPESWWGLDWWSSIGPEASFYVLGDDGAFSDDITLEPTHGLPTWIRALYDHDDGAGFSTIEYFTSIDGSAWTSHGSATVGPAGLVPSGNPELTLSVLPSTVIQEMIIIDSATSTTIMSPDFSAQDEDTTSFVDAQGNTWTILES